VVETPNLGVSTNGYSELHREAQRNYNRILSVPEIR